VLSHPLSCSSTRYSSLINGCIVFFGFFLMQWYAALQRIWEQKLSQCAKNSLWTNMKKTLFCWRKYWFPDFVGFPLVCLTSLNVCTFNISLIYYVIYCCTFVRFFSSCFWVPFCLHLRTLGMQVIYIYIGSLGWSRKLIKWTRMTFCVNNLRGEID